MTLLFNVVAASAAASQGGHATGLEWMVIASLLVPAVLIVVLLYLGARNTV